MNICMHQINTTAGDVKLNYELILQSVTSSKATIHLFPELCLSGYGCEDWLLNEQFIDQCHQYIELLRQKLPSNAWVIIGTPSRQNNQIYNSAIVIHNQSIITIANKQCLPNHSVFSEKRYFHEGKESTCITVEGKKFLILICYDAWNPDKIKLPKQKRFDGVLTLNASPYYQGSLDRRVSILKKLNQTLKAPIFYCNTVGTQDQYVFDGSSIVLTTNGALSQLGQRFKQDHIYSSLNEQTTSIQIEDTEKHMYQAIVQSISDFTEKNSIRQVIIGLSGGIDSALTLTLAHDALGPQRIVAVYMPSEFSSPISLEDAQTLTKNLTIQLTHLPINELIDTYQKRLSPLIPCEKGSITHQNLQARIRATLLMAMSNQSSSIVLATSNKSEISTGYSTLYGDSAGGYAPINDLNKHQVYLLAKWRNLDKLTIPNRIIERAPSAELAPDQYDSDDLPPYSQLDPFIDTWMSNHQLAKTNHALGKTIANAEFKRKQCPIGPRVNRISFGKDWRFPLTQKINLDQ
ncbi:MAG TPA: NAD+ synthase [Gammaproteobacteria bacterium]|nr:NAD+ synthase [Gammaproteobacteria bacterium]